jgi:rare lipoprotein A (peptidoglycan hydrolase)
MSGPDCERHVNWYTAGADRFGCGAKLKVVNPSNGKSAVVAVLDRGPACWVEDKVDHWVDLSYPASYHLFGEPKAATEKGLVVVEEVGNATPVGPL